MAMTGGDRGGGGMMSEINVTPLVDVMLVLLIIFMVTATLIRVEDAHEREVDMTLPETRTEPPTTDSDRLILRIDSQLQVRLNDDHLVDCSAALHSTDSERFEPCFDELQRQIEAHPRAIQEGSVYILAEIAVPYGFVVGSLHRIRVAGVGSVGMVTDPAFLAGLQTTEN